MMPPSTRRTTVLFLLAVFIVLLYRWTPSDVSARGGSQYKPLVNDPILGGKTATKTADAAPAVTTTTQAAVAAPAPPLVAGGQAAPEKAAETKTENFGTEKHFYQEDLKLDTYPPPSFDVRKLGQYKPHNSKLRGNPTYGLYYATRNATLQDPYFLGAQQILYRLLWDPRSKSKKHPVTIWVAPFVSQAHRDVFVAEGARVREIPLIEWNPTAPTEARWRDTFSKLNLWNETEYSRIMFMDLDAFPIENVDGLLEIGEAEDRCIEDRLPPALRRVKNEICDYVFVGAHGEWEEVNVGVVVFKPNTAMYNHLVAEFQNPDKFDNKMAEQAFLNEIYHPDGPFPVRWVNRDWNAAWTKDYDKGKVKVVHEKLWAMWFNQDHWAASYFFDTWQQMLKLYNSKDFEMMRAADGLL